MMWVNNTTRWLPSTYQEVEWVWSSRTQVINTWVIPATQTYTAELEVESTQSGGEYWAFGIWGTTGFRWWQDSSWHWDTSYWASYSPSTYALNTKTKITMSNAWKWTSSNTAIWLFWMWENGAYANNRKWAYKIYYCKIWNSWTLIRDFVPCYRISDSVIWMYDLVNDQFYTNSWTWTFTKWADIPDMVEKQVRPKRTIPYDNIYVFLDWIYTWTDSAPKTTTIYSDNTIRACFFDRETKVLWLWKTDWVWYYSFDSNSYTSVVSESISYELNNDNWFVFLENYILFRWATSNWKYYVIDRKDKTLSRTISFSTTNYSWVDMWMCYDYNYDYRCRNQWYRQSKVVDLTTWNDGSNIFTTSYHGCRMFNWKFYISCENWSNNGRVYGSDWSYVQVTSWSNMGYWGIVFLADSWHITKVTSSDYEYDRIVLWPTRSSTASKIIKWWTTLESDYTWAEHWNFIKYNDEYSIIQFDYGQRDSYNFWFAVRKKSDWTLTRHSFWLSTIRNTTTCVSITQTWNLWFYRIWIFDIDWNNIYSSDTFIWCVSNDIYWL